MRIRFAKVSAATGTSSRDLEIAEGATVAQVLEAAGENIGQNMAVAVDGMVTTDMNAQVSDGAIVTLTSQIKGA